MTQKTFISVISTNFKKVQKKFKEAKQRKEKKTASNKSHTMIDKHKNYAISL